MCLAKPFTRRACMNMLPPSREGQEASYAALSYIFPAGKLIVARFRRLLAKYCPEFGERHSGAMWLVIALSHDRAVGLILLRRYIACASRKGRLKSELRIRSRQGPKAAAARWWGGPGVRLVT